MKLIVTVAMSSAFLFAGCATTTETTTEKKPIAKTFHTDSRIAKRGSPKSRGVDVVQFRRVKEQGTAQVGEALQKISPQVTGVRAP